MKNNVGTDNGDDDRSQKIIRNQHSKYTDIVL